jgi:hypothetical protein
MRIDIFKDVKAVGKLWNMSPGSWLRRGRDHDRYKGVLDDEAEKDCP